MTDLRENPSTDVRACRQPRVALRPTAASVTVVSRVENASLAARCIPSGFRGEPVAGDFFDVIWLDEFRLLLAVGDVAGHGVGAAARMTQLRAETRELAQLAVSPADLLAGLDVMQVERHLEDIATLWLGIYDVQTGLLQYSSAGHPPLVLAGIVGGPQLLAEASAPPIGTGCVMEHAVVDQVQLPIGALLVGYSDGLVERPECDLEDQIAVLRDVVDRTNRLSPADVSLVDLMAAILAELLPDPGTARDDVCLLMLRREAC
jgi:serine phosphatase RsbU (regulator of sigma subunit)